jgi:geranylgeranyl diphosphate synthase type I
MGRRPPTGSAPPGLAAVAGGVEARLALLFDAELARWSALDPDLAEPLARLRDLVLGGGKRLRPALCHWAGGGAGGPPGDPCVGDAGAALERLLAFARVHDDVMDGSATRRGRDTVHVAFQRRHAEAGWRGEARRFGEGVAILVGDLAFVYADLLMAGAPPDAARVFTELRLEVNVGQYLDLLGTVRGDASRTAARRIAEYKSGKYTVERPLHLGAALAGRLGELAPALSAYGLPLGEAFQLRDDTLGAFGDAALLGKPVGDDLREGKPTALVALARERATGAAARLLEDRLGARDLSERELGDLQAVLVDTGALDEVESAIEALVGEAVAALDALDVTPEAREELAALAAFVGARRH